MDASNLLKEEGIYVNVTEIVSTNLLDKAGMDYQNSLINPNLPSLFIEMGSPYGLKGYAKNVYAINSFGASGNAKDIIPYFGFTKELVKEAFKNILK